MVQTLQEFVLAYSSVPDLLLAVAKSSFLLSLAIFVCAKLRHNSAAMRHQVWMFALLGSLLTPAVACLLPRQSVAILPAPESATGSESLPPFFKHAGNSSAMFAMNPSLLQTGEKAGSPEVSSFLPGHRKATDATRVPPVRYLAELQHHSLELPPGPSLTVALVIAFVWFCGFLVTVTPFLLIWGLQSISHQRLKEITLTDWHFSIKSLEARLGLCRKLKTFVSPHACVPAVFGVFSPYLVVPWDWHQWSNRQRECVLLHELAHVKRNDLVTQALGRLVTAVYWFNPLAWHALRQLRIERELACDDLVLQAGTIGSDYATELIRTCRRYRVSRLSLGVAMAHSSRLDHRIEAILDAERCRRAPGRLTTWCYMLATTVLAIISGAPSFAATSNGSGIRNGATLKAVVFDEATTADTLQQEKLAPFEWFIPGIVEDENGQTVAGARIETLHSWLGKRPSTESSEDGQFMLNFRTKRPLGSPLVVSSHDGKTKAIVKAYRHDKAQRLIRVVLKPSKSLVVIVNDETGQPTPGAAVGVLAEHELIASATTDDKGKAIIEVPADSLVQWVFACQPGIGFDYYENYSSVPILHPLPLPNEISLTLADCRNVKVRVLDSDQKPVSGVRVKPRAIQIRGKLSDINLGGSAQFDMLNLTAMTDESGVAEFPWISRDVANDIPFVVSRPQHFSPGVSAHGTGDEEISVHILRVALVRGKVTQSDGTPLPSVRIVGQGLNTPFRQFRGEAMTISDGTYEMEVYPDLKTTIGVADSLHAAKSSTGLLFKEGEVREGVDFVAGEGTLIRGVITAGEDRQPAAGSYVSLAETSDGSLVNHGCLTDENGYYRFRVGPGSYRLSLPHQKTSNQLTLEITNEVEIEQNGHSEVNSKVPLIGTVVDDTGGSVANCRIFGEPISRASGRGGFQTITDADGKFSLERWPFNMIVYADHGESKMAGYVVIADNTKDTTIRLSPTALATGKILDANGNPAANAVVGLQISTPLVKGGQRLHASTSTDENGVFRFEGVAISTHCEVYVYRNRVPVKILEFDVESAEPMALKDFVSFEEIDRRR